MNQITKPQDTSRIATAEEIGQAMELLSTSLPYREAGNGEIRTMAYLSALSGVTRYGLSKATQAALRGEHGSTFFPSTAELRALYDAAMRPVHEQARRESNLRKQMDDRKSLDAAHSGPKRTAEEITGSLRSETMRSERVLDGTRIGVSIAKAKTQMEGRRIIKTGVSIEEFRRGAKSRSWPNGAVYSALLQTVYE